MDYGKEFSMRRKEIKKIAMKKLRDGPPIFNRQAGFYITITGGGIDEFLNQPHKHYNEKNEMLLSIDDVLKEAEYKGKGRGISLYSISDSNRVLTGIEKPV